MKQPFGGVTSVPPKQDEQLLTLTKGRTKVPPPSAWVWCLAVMLMGSGEAWAYDPPRIIGTLQGVAPDSQWFGRGFCWVGDQNSDGYDDLLLIHDDYPYDDRQAVNAVKLYFGGERIDNEPDLVFQGSNGEALGTEGFLGYAGRLDTTSSNWIIIGSLYWDNNQLSESRIHLYRGGAALDSIADVTFRSSVDSILVVESSEQMRPSDFNSDGYDDLMIALGGRSTEKSAVMLIFNGGNVFDTIPDYCITLPFTRFRTLGTEWLAGSDINGDRYDDLVVISRQEILFYLGGSPMDTVAFLHIDWTEFAPKHLKYFAMLGDVNGDGYDDWGCYWYELGVMQDRDGFYVFYGSEQPDMEPDKELRGSAEVWDVGNGLIAGGDMNGDSISDIVTTISGAYHAEGQLEIFLGSRWFDGRSVILRNIAQTYPMFFGWHLGAIGDYNGDGMNDFVSGWYPEYGDWEFGKLSILAGSADWHVSVKPEPIVPVREFSITLAPNPFNGRLTISYSIPSSSSLSSLSLFDVNGRLVRRLAEGIQTAGEHSVTVNGLQSGLYFVALETTTAKEVRKIVCIR